MSVAAQQVIRANCPIDASRGQSLNSSAQLWALIGAGFFGEETLDHSGGNYLLSLRFRSPAFGLYRR